MFRSVIVVLQFIIMLFFSLLPCCFSVYYNINRHNSLSHNNSSYTVFYPLIVFGDSRANYFSQPYRQLIWEINVTRPYLVIGTGDHTGNGSIEQIDSFIESMSYCERLSATIGNHDVKSGNLDYWINKVNDINYYRDDVPGWRIVIASTETNLTETYMFLQKALNTSKHKIVVIHKPIYPDVGYNLGEPWRTLFHNLFREYNVDLVLQGHWHGYAETVVDGVRYIITGGAGAPLYQQNGHYHYLYLILFTNGSYIYEPIGLEPEYGNITIIDNNYEKIIINNKKNIYNEKVWIPSKLLFRLNNSLIELNALIPSGTTNIHISENGDIESNQSIIISSIKILRIPKNSLLVYNDVHFLIAKDIISQKIVYRSKNHTEVLENSIMRKNNIVLNGTITLTNCSLLIRKLNNIKIIGLDAKFIMDNSSIEIINCKNITIKNIEFIIDTLNYRRPILIFIHYNVKNILFSNLNISIVRPVYVNKLNTTITAILLSDVQNMTIRDCFIDYFSKIYTNSRGISIYNCTDIKIINNYIKSNSTALSVVDFKNITITNNTLIGGYKFFLYSSGVISYGSGVNLFIVNNLVINGSHNGIVAKYGLSNDEPIIYKTKNIYIINNTIIGSLDDAIDPNGDTNLYIINNTLINYENNGISLELNCENVVVEGNYIWSNRSKSSKGIRIDWITSKNIVVRNNLIHVRSYGFYIGDAYNVTITNNYIESFKDTGIYLHRGDTGQIPSKVLVEHNYINAPIGLLSAYSGNNVTIRNNTISAQIAFYLKNEGSIDIINNVINARHGLRCIEYNGSVGLDGNVIYTSGKLIWNTGSKDYRIVFFNNYIRASGHLISSSNSDGEIVFYGNIVNMSNPNIVINDNTSLRLYVDNVSYVYGFKEYIDSVGNYWVNYQGLDKDLDGIGDTPFNISGKYVDLAPLAPSFIIQYAQYCHSNRSFILYTTMGKFIIEGNKTLAVNEYIYRLNNSEIRIKNGIVELNFYVIEEILSNSSFHYNKDYYHCHVVYKIVLDRPGWILFAVPENLTLKNILIDGGTGHFEKFNRVIYIRSGSSITITLSSSLNTIPGTIISTNLENKSSTNNNIVMLLFTVLLSCLIILIIVIRQKRQYLKQLMTTE